MRSVLILLAASASTAAYAQHTPAVENTQEIIIVRVAPLAHLREEILQGATVLERAEILEELGLGLGATLDNQPGVSSTGFGAGASRPIIRGLGEDRIRVLSNGLAQIDASTVSPDHAVVAEGLEAERIEILRGPAALAYGGNALGGVVNVVDGVIAERRPEELLSGRAYGDYTLGLRGGQGAGQATLGLGPLVLSGQGFRRTSEDFVIPGFAFSEALREELTQEALLAGEAPPEFAENRAPNSATDAAQFDFGLSFVGDLFGRKAFAGASFQRLTTTYGIPEAGGEEEGGEEEAIFPGPFIDLAVNRYEAKAGIENLGFFAEARASLAVVDYEHQEIEPSGEVGTDFGNAGVNARLELTHKPLFGGLTGLWGFEAQTQDFSALGEEAFITPTDTRDFAGFLIERYESGPLSIEGGLRYGQVTVENIIAPERSFDLFSASLGVGYQASEGVFLGFNAARTERAPTQVELFSEGPHLATASFDVGNPDLGEERNWSFEGVGRFTQGPLRLEVSAYANIFNGFIGFLPNGEIEDGLPVFVYEQRDARFVGAEVVGAYELYKSGEFALVVDGALDIVRARFEGGEALPRIPPLSTRLGLEGAAGLFGLRLEWERAGAQERVPEFEAPTDGFNLFNARLSFKPVENSPVRFLIDGRNLTNEEARVATSFVRELLPRPGRTVRFATVLEF